MSLCSGLCVVAEHGVMMEVVSESYIARVV